MEIGLFYCDSTAVLRLHFFLASFHAEVLLIHLGHIDPSVAVEKLALDLVGVSGNDEPLSSKEISSASRVIRTASQMAGSDVNQLTIPQVRSLTKVKRNLPS